MAAGESKDQFLPEYETVSTLFYKLTSPVNNGHVDRDLLATFCRKIDCEPAGRSVALQVMIHKIQSPYEAEALITLEVLKTCVESCDSAFRQEIGKFKFLNELIKVLSPKYLGNKSSEKVKRRISELFYSWTLLMPTQPKIAEAYRLLRKQNLIVGNPDKQSLQENERNHCTQSQRMSSIFNDSSRTQRIAELLKSSNPDDIMEANRLIKRLAQEDELRATKLYQRSIKVRSIRTSAVVLDEMIDNFDAKSDSYDIIRLLYNELKENSVTLQEMARSADEMDDKLGEVLEVNDLTLHVLKRFEDSKLQERFSPIQTPDRDDVTELINLVEDQTSAPDLIADDAGPSAESLVDEALCEVFSSKAAVNSPVSDNDDLNNVILRESSKNSKEKLNIESIAQPSAFFELDKMASQMVDEELDKAKNSPSNRVMSKEPDTLLDLLEPIDLVEPTDSSVAEDLSEVIQITQTVPAKLDTDFKLSLSDFSPIEGSSPKKLIERKGLRLTVFQGKRLKAMSSDSCLILLTLENNGPEHIVDLEIDFGEDTEILQREGTKVGELLPANPVLPTSSYIQLFLLRQNQSTVEINLSYKVNSDRHFLHAEYSLV